MLFSLFEISNGAKKALKIGGVVAGSIAAGHLGERLNVHHYTNDANEYIGKREHEARELEAQHAESSKPLEQERKKLESRAYDPFDKKSVDNFNRDAEAHNAKVNSHNKALLQSAKEFNDETEKTAQDKYDSYKNRRRLIGGAGLAAAVLGGRHVAKKHDENNANKIKK